MKLMHKKVTSITGSFDWILFSAIIPIMLAGLITMHSFSEDNGFFTKQLISIGISLVVFFAISFVDVRFLRRTSVVVSLYAFVSVLLIALFITGSVFQGAQSWFSFGFFAFQPAELSKLVLIILLAKYFSRRHIEIRDIRHILVSGAYTGIIFLLVLAQPDFGSALIIFMIWFGIVMVSGISKKHLLAVMALGAISFGFLWTFIFADYQKTRIVSFLHPMADVRGVGYNAYQSTITVGSGQLLGKGIGYGTQSRLKFLPEYQTDFIFAAYAEEWGFVGVMLLMFLYVVVIWRILRHAIYGATNFEIFFSVGLAIMFMSHIIIHVGMNIGLLPVTGLTIPFMSYGGTHLLVSFIALGILMSQHRYSRLAHRSELSNEFFGV